MHQINLIISKSQVKKTKSLFLHSYISISVEKALNFKHIEDPQGFSENSKAAKCVLPKWLVSKRLITGAGLMVRVVWACGR